MIATWSEHAKSGEAYSAEDFILASPGLYPHVQLFNPVGSGIRVRLRSVHQIGVAAVQSNVRRYDPPGAILGPPIPFIIENMLGGGPAAVAEIRHANIVVPSGSPFWLLQGLARAPAIYPLRGQEWGHDLLEGHGILLQASAGTTLIANWQWVELEL